VVVTGRLSLERYPRPKKLDNGEEITELVSALVIENAVVAVDLSRGAARYFRTDRDLPEPTGVPSWLRSSPSTVPVDANGVVPENWDPASIDNEVTELDAFGSELIAA